MASQWYSLVSRKVYLARTLLAQLDAAESVQSKEALWQGAVELSLRSRRLLMLMVTRFYQDKQSEPGTLEEMRVQLGDDIPEIAELDALARGSSNWWIHLDQLEYYQARPPTAKKTVSDENIIAVAVDDGPDPSSKALTRTLADLKHFTDVLEERHSEW